MLHSKYDNMYVSSHLVLSFPPTFLLLLLLFTKRLCDKNYEILLTDFSFQLNWRVLKRLFQFMAWIFEKNGGVCEK